MFSDCYVMSFHLIDYLWTQQQIYQTHMYTHTNLIFIFLNLSLKTNSFNFKKIKEVTKSVLKFTLKKILTIKM